MPAKFARRDVTIVVVANEVVRPKAYLASVTVRLSTRSTMTDRFDPYYKWLGIPPKDQPPHHYRLLTIDAFETDPEVIEAAANRLMSYVQGCATGPYVEASQKLLNEISAARLCLLDKPRKLKYDQQLRAKIEREGAPERLSEQPSGQSTSLAAPAALTPELPGEDALLAATLELGPHDLHRQRGLSAPRRGQQTLALAALVVLAMILATITAVALNWPPNEIVQVDMRTGPPGKGAPDTAAQAAAEQPDKSAGESAPPPTKTKAAPLLAKSLESVRPKQRDKAAKAILAKAPDEPNEQARTALFEAVIAGADKADIAARIAQGALLEAKNPAGRTPLFEAILEGQLGVAQALMDAGADAAAVDAQGRTALMAASQEGYASLVEQLLEHGAKVNAQTAPNDNAEGGLTALHVAAAAGKTLCVRALIDGKANVHLGTEQKVTPLMIAAGTRQIESVKILLAADADPNACDVEGQTPLMYAASTGDAEIVSALLRAGALSAKARNDGATALSLLPDKLADADSPLARMLQAGAKR